MKKLTLVFAALATIIGFGVILGAPAARAIDVWGNAPCVTNSQDELCKASKNDRIEPLFQKILSLLLYAIGAVAVIMIVVGGIKYTTSNGDSNSIQSAKNTILYSVIGLVVAILGQAIILFVVNWLK